MADKAKAGREQPGDPAHDQIAAVIRAITALVTGTPNLIGFDFADLRVALIGRGRAVFGRVSRKGRTGLYGRLRRPQPTSSAICASPVG